MEISVVILSWNDKRYLEECLASLSQAPTSRSTEIIVVDNASTDGSPELVKAAFPAVKLIKNPENLGFSNGNNVGIRASAGKYICLLNSDIKVLGGCLDTLADYMDHHPDIGMIGPKILNSDMTHQSSCRRFPTLWNNWCEVSALARAFPASRLFSGEHMFYFKGDRRAEVDVLVGCFWMVRRAAVDEFGLLDDGFFMFAEDLDWCKRCWRAGWRVVFLPAAQAIHYRGGSSTKKDAVWLAVTQQRSVLRYWKKHHGVLGWLAMSCLVLVHRSLRGAIALIHYATRPSRREDSQTRLHVAAECLKAVFSRPKRAT
jgi:GT2 family glycosyltransferase